MRPISTNQKNPSDIVLIRIDLGLSQEDLARLLGLSAWTVCRYESGKRTPPRWYHLAMRCLQEHYGEGWLLDSKD